MEYNFGDTLYYKVRKLFYGWGSLDNKVGMLPKVYVT